MASSHRPGGRASKGVLLPRVQVLADVAGRDPEVMLTEHVDAEVLSDDYYAGQLVERMGWALADAEKHEETVT
jgi:hypothetical protein